MKKRHPDQMDLFEWAGSRPQATIIDLVPIIIRLMPDFDPRYPEPAKVIRLDPKRERSAAA